ncbi:DUF4913 domain-containing protein [Marinactinospora thermotolerans]|uniref:DUF4913 domain-containing protein n=1 Tax=Marinactinospora thermotolerans TaxID=531310 RepID=UPI003D932151
MSEDPMADTAADDSAGFWDEWLQEIGQQTVAAEESPSPPVDPADPAESEESEEARPVYDSLEEWVQFYFLPMFRRVEGGENKWCQRWWEHSEAIARLDALWRAWESLRLDEQTGMSTWFRDHADHHIPLLMGQNGPFRQCAGERHRESNPLHAEWAPDGWWEGEE